MKYDYDYIRVERVEELLRLRGLTDRQAAKLLWGDKPTNHRSLLKEVQKTENMGIKRICQICEILDVEIDYFLQNSDKKTDIPIIAGNIKDTENSYKNNEITSLKAEIKALEMLIKEKNERIEDLKKSNDDIGKRLDYLLKLGHNSDVL